MQAKTRFPLLHWQRPQTFNQHFYFHAVGQGIDCNLDHALAV